MAIGHSSAKIVGLLSILKAGLFVLTATAFAETLTLWPQGPLRKPPVFVTADIENPAKLIEHSLAEWQALGDDAHSINQDPLFVNPTYPADDFRLRPDSPALKIGFVPFDPNQAGRTPAAIKVPPIPAAFPVLKLDPEKEYHQPR